MCLYVSVCVYVWACVCRHVCICVCVLVAFTFLIALSKHLINNLRKAYSGPYFRQDTDTMGRKMWLQNQVEAGYIASAVRKWRTDRKYSPAIKPSY